MRNRMYGGVRGREMKVGGKLLHFPPTRFVVKVFNCTFFLPNCLEVSDIFRNFATNRRHFCGKCRV